VVVETDRRGIAYKFCDQRERVIKLGPGRDGDSDARCLRSGRLQCRDDQRRITVRREDQTGETGSAE